MEGDRTSERLAPLIELVHRRWNIPILAELYQRGGAKFVTLVNALDVGRASLAASLAHLIEMGLVMKNPGHGHPMRPEYVLTDAGKAVGEACLDLTKAFTKAADVDLALRKWTLPLVAAISKDVRRFNELSRALPNATPRAVTLGLKGLTAQDWVNRTVIDDYPPTVGYELSNKGLRILDRIDALFDRGLLHQAFRS